MISIQSKIFLFFCCISIIITLIKYKNITLFTTKLIVYYFILNQIECNINGNCNLAAWFVILIPTKVSDSR